MSADPTWEPWALEWYAERLAIMQADDVPDAARLAKIRTEAEILRRVQEAEAKAAPRGATK